MGLIRDAILKEVMANPDKTAAEIARLVKCAAPTVRRELYILLEQKLVQKVEGKYFGLGPKKNTPAVVDGLREVVINDIPTLVVGVSDEQAQAAIDEATADGFFNEDGDDPKNKEGIGHLDGEDE